MPTGDNGIDWRSYDSVVALYDDVAVPRFTPLARDLVATVAPAEAATVLDVGTGTGLAAQYARAAVGPEGFVVGVDPSPGMLALARASREVTVVAAMTPGLPLRADVFDVVVANLVLSHVPDYAAALLDIVRVLRHGGRFGCTAWGPNEPAHDENEQDEAGELLDSTIRSCGIDTTLPVEPVPWEEHLRDCDRLAATLGDAGLGDVAVDLHTYRWVIPVDRYVDGRDWTPRHRYLRGVAGPSRWDDIRAQAVAELRGRFGASIRAIGHVWVAVGAKP
jgi:O-methyltransferase/aklanonic acid methyltransferase